MNTVRAGFFSFTEITDPAEHRSYNEWHQFDHMPEQFPIPGIVFGQRWVSTPACRAARAVDEAPLDVTHYMTLYLVSEPVRPTLDEFADLGERLRLLGRFHQHRRAHLSGPLQFLDAQAARRVLVSPEAVPYRPNMGVYTIVEQPTDRDRLDAFATSLHREQVPALLDVPGVAGVWSFATTPIFGRDRWQTGHHRITVCYLDGPPLDVADGVRPLLDARWRDAPVRPVLAGPMETIVPGQWDWFDGEPGAG